MLYNCINLNIDLCGNCVKSLNGPTKYKHNHICSTGIYYETIIKYSTTYKLKKLLIENVFINSRGEHFIHSFSVMIIKYFPEMEAVLQANLLLK